MTEQQIKQIVETLAKQHNISTESNEELPYALAYFHQEDKIYYNPSEIIDYYRELKELDSRLDLEELIKHCFGHELGHRKKYKSCTPEDIKLDFTLLNIFHYPEETINLLPEEHRTRFPIYRAHSIAYELFEEYYAEKENPLASPHITKLSTLSALQILKEHLPEVRRVIHSLISFSSEAITAYFIAPLAKHPPRILRIFPEYPILLKIRKFCEKEIITPSDVFDKNKIEKIAEIILYEL